MSVRLSVTRRYCIRVLQLVVVQQIHYKSNQWSLSSQLFFRFLQITVDQRKRCQLKFDRRRFTTLPHTFLQITVDQRKRCQLKFDRRRFTTLPHTLVDNTLVVTQSISRSSSSTADRCSV